MPTYTFLSGEAIEYPDPAPAVADHLARLHAAAADPRVGTAGMVELVYGDTNPLLDRSVVPGRPIVTAAVHADPVFRVMLDLIGVKRVQLGSLVPAEAGAAYTVSVKDAAGRLGITPAAVRAAIVGGKLAGRRRNGQWYASDAAVSSYAVSNRGRKKRGPAGAVVRVRAGSEPGKSLSVRVACGELVSEAKDGGAVIGHLPDGWERATVRTTAAGKVRAFEIEPAAGEEAIELGGLFVRGSFRITRKVNNPRQANAAWAAAGHAPS